MIAKSAVKAFMNRELRDLSVIKNWEETKVDRFIEQSLQFTPTNNPFNTNPYKHQKKCFVLAVRNPNFLFFLDMGLGKTAITLWYLKRNPDALPAVVVCPASVKYVWERESKRFGLGADVLEGQLSDCRRLPLLTIVNYDILKAWKDRLRATKPNTPTRPVAKKITLTGSGIFESGTRRWYSKCPSCGGAMGSSLANPAFHAVES